METHAGLELANCLLDSENDLEGLQRHALSIIKQMGIISPNDPRYNQIAHLSDGILGAVDSQKYFRYIYRTICSQPVFPTIQTVFERKTLTNQGTSI